MGLRRERDAGSPIHAHGPTVQGAMLQQPGAELGIQRVGIQLLQDTPEGGFGGRSPAPGAQAPQGIAREVLGPLGDSIEPAGSGQGRAHRNRHHGHDRMAYPAPLARVHHRAQ